MKFYKKHIKPLEFNIHHNVFYNSLKYFGKEFKSQILQVYWDQNNIIYTIYRAINSQINRISGI